MAVNLEDMTGTTNPDGSVNYPKVSISGNPNYERPPTQMYQLGGGKFVVLDIFPPEGFNTEEALEAFGYTPAQVPEETPAPTAPPEDVLG